MIELRKRSMDASVYIPGLSSKVKAKYQTGNTYNLNESIINYVLNEPREKYGDARAIDVYLNTKDPGKMVVKSHKQSMTEEDVNSLVGKKEGRRTYSYNPNDIYKVTLASPSDPTAYAPGGIYSDRYDSLIKDKDYYKLYPQKKKTDYDFKRKVDDVSNVAAAVRGVPLHKRDNSEDDDNVDMVPPKPKSIKPQNSDKFKEPENIKVKDIDTINGGIDTTEDEDEEDTTTTTTTTVTSTESEDSSMRSPKYMNKYSKAILSGDFSLHRDFGLFGRKKEKVKPEPTPVVDKDEWEDVDIYDYAPHGPLASKVNSLPRKYQEELFKYDPLELAYEEEWPNWYPVGDTYGYKDYLDLSPEETDKRIKAWPAYDKFRKWEDLRNAKLYLEYEKPELVDKYVPEDAKRWGAMTLDEVNSEMDKLFAGDQCSKGKDSFEELV